ncbi:Phospholipase [Mycena sanguinolenta]|uniref:Phospholipase n=1 Tax=Mycena sanguinolenta TaxID=230812 RepID=A0A8H6XHP1_9AGAR|nr:Phospholipase [Mycena sanguinolenta]
MPSPPRSSPPIDRILRPQMIYKTAALVVDKTQYRDELDPRAGVQDAAAARFEATAKEMRGDENDDFAGNVPQHMLPLSWMHTYTSRSDCQPMKLLIVRRIVVRFVCYRVATGLRGFGEHPQPQPDRRGHSEIALVVEDTHMMDSTMDGEPYRVTRFILPLLQVLRTPRPHPAADRRSAPRAARRVHVPRTDAEPGRDGHAARDPLSDNILELWFSTARKNLEILTELFCPLPANLVRNWKVYENYVPKVKTEHVVHGVSLDRVKKRLGCACRDFLVDEEFVQGADWEGLNPTLLIYT